MSLRLSCVAGGLGIGLVPALALADLPRGRVLSEPARVPPRPVTLVRGSIAHRRPALTRLMARLTAEGRRVGARLRRR